MTLLACPRCHERIDLQPDRGDCAGCGASFHPAGGVWILATHGSDHDELDHTCAKEAQAQYFDRERASDFEIERPFGAPRLHRWLLESKFERATRRLGGRLAGAAVLVACGGSGMDAEFLARAGARVVTSDLSLGAAQRAKERSRRHQVVFESIVADVEHLPFGDGSFDIVYVHDGLHHLGDPLIGLREMARVARTAVIVTEPARAFVTRIAVRLGLALEVEEAGNRVARLDPAEVAHELEQAGFTRVAAERYVMYYKHEPGPLTALLSRQPFFAVARLALASADRLLGRWGNKFVVVAGGTSGPG